MTPFLKEVAQDLYNKFGLDIQHCAIVFNNKRPATYIQKYLADIIQKPFFSPKIYTIQEFFSAAVPEKVADFYLQFFTLLEIYNQLLKEEGLQTLKSSQFFPLAKIILSDFSQIDNDLVDADKLYRELEDISKINLEFDYLTAEQYQFLSQFWQSYSEGRHKRQQELFIQMWRRMPRLYHLFHQKLKEKHCITNAGAYRHLANTNIGEVDFIKDFEKGKIVFVGFNALSKAEAKLFAQLQESGKAIFYFDTDSYYLNDPLQEAGLFLRKNIEQLQLKNEFDNEASYLKAKNRPVNVYQVQGQAAQAKILNNILESDYLKNEEVGTTAVILADESLLIPALQTIPVNFQDHAVELNVTMGFPLNISTVYGLADLWLTTQLELRSRDGKSKIGYENIEAFLSHPLTGITQANKNKILKKLLEENAVEVDSQRLLNQKGIFEKFYTRIEEPSQLIPQLLSVMEFLLQRLSNRNTLKKIDAELLVKTIQELNRLNDTITPYIIHEELEFVITLIQKALQNISVPLSGDPLNGIQLMGLLETRNLNFDKVVFLGFNEGIIPKTSIGSSFIPDSIRRVFGLPVLENLDAISSYMVYRLLQRSKNINFVYNSLTDESTTGEASRILKQLAYESGYDFNYYELNLSISTEKGKDFEINKNNPQIIEALNRFLTKQKTISPSALSTYIANPVDFFFNYIAGIKEPQEVTGTIEANELGTILHLVMERFYEQFKGLQISKEQIHEQRKNLRAVINAAFCETRKLPLNTHEFSGMQEVVMAIVEAYASIILDRDENEAPFKIIDLEYKISVEIPFELNGKQESIKIYGIVDRVDEKDGVVRIIDYKTGKDKLSYGAIDKLFDTDDKHINKALIQTLLYTYAFEIQSGIKDVEPNLYVVRTMSDGNVHFKSGKQTLKHEYLAETKAEFLTNLQLKLQELFDLNIPFKVSAVPDNYQYSIYKTLFNR